jgi:diacylglycerol kinase family enzyme
MAAVQTAGIARDPTNENPPPDKILHLLNPGRRHGNWALAKMRGRHRRSPWARVSREHPQHTDTLVAWALEEGVRRLVVWGGDGTLHRVARALWRAEAFEKMEVALVPVGTCNDLARRFGLSLDDWRLWESPEPAGRVASLAVGHLRWEGEKVQGEDVFINNAGFGRARESYERKDPPWRTLLGFRPHNVEVRWGKGRLRGVYYMALTALGPYFSGGLHFEPDISPEDGRLRVYLVPASGKARLAWRLWRGQRGAPLFDRKITKLTAEEVSISTTNPVWPQVDGEAPPGEVSSMTFRVLPDRLRLRTPR